MLSNNQKLEQLKNKIDIKSQYSTDDFLLKNQEIINSFLLESYQKKDKFFTNAKDLQIIKEYEDNLINLLERCPPSMLKELMNETGLDTEYLKNIDLESENINIKNSNSI